MENSMSLLQKSFALIGMLFAFLWLTLLVAQPIVEYVYGSGGFSSFLHKLLVDVFIGIIGFVAISFALRWIGAFPRVEMKSADIAWNFGAQDFVFMLAFWVLTGLILAAVFSLFPTLFGDKRFMDMFIDVFPMILLIGTWICLMASMSLRSRRNLKTSSNSGE